MSPLKLISSRVLVVTIVLLAGILVLALRKSRETNTSIDLGAAAIRDDTAPNNELSHSVANATLAAPKDLISRSDLGASPPDTATDALSIIRVNEATTGAPVPEAYIVNSEHGSRLRKQESLAIRGKSDSDGKIAMAVEARSEFDVFADGYVSSSVVVSPGASETVSLVRGHTLDVECVSQGVPIPGCMAVVSQRELPPISAGSEALIMAGTVEPRASGVLKGISGEDGIASIRGLVDGSYYLDVYAYGYAPVKVSPLDPVDVPRNRVVRVELERMLVLMPEVHGDEVLSFDLRCPTAGMSTRSQRYLSAEQDRLMQQYPTALEARVILERDWRGSGPGGQFEIILSILARRTGMHSFRLVPIPLLEWSHPTSLELNENTGDGQDVAAINVVCRDATGDDAPDLVGKFRIEIDGKISAPLKPGINWLPRGTYEIECSDSRLEKRFSPTQLVVPGDLTLAVESPLQRVRLVVADRNGVQFARYKYTLSNSGSRSIHFAFDATNRVFVLPCGPTLIELKALGFREETYEFFVEKQEGIQELVCELHEK